jgi:hypothetical protein
MISGKLGRSDLRQDRLNLTFSFATKIIGEEEKFSSKNFQSG